MPAEVVALGHLAQVVFVQELAGLALFAQAAHPVLAYQAVEVGRRVVLVRAGGPERAVALQKGFAYGPVGVETEAVFAREEGREGEVVGWDFGGCGGL
jgi:hypothetical protein